MKKWCQKTFISIWKYPMNTTAKIFPAHYFPNMFLFKIFNRINLSVGATIVRVDLKLIRKKNRVANYHLTSSLTKKKCLDIFWADDYSAKNNKDNFF